MLVTDDDAIAERARSCRCTASAATPGSATPPSGSWYYEIEDAGFKYNMTDIAAALGLVQLDRAEELLGRAASSPQRLHASASRRRRRRICSSCPTDAAGRITRLASLSSSGSTSTGCAIDRAAASSTASRAAGIGTSVHFIPLHLHPYYRAHGRLDRGGISRWPTPSTSA